MKTRIDLAYEDLANAVVLQAVEDYRNALKGKGYDNKSPERIIGELEKFFRSEYYEVLTKVNGEYLIEKLREEHLENERRNNESNADTSNPESNRNDF